MGIKIDVGGKVDVVINIVGIRELIAAIMAAKITDGDVEALQSALHGVELAAKRLQQLDEATPAV